MEHGVLEFTNALIAEVDSRTEARLNDVEGKLETSLQIFLSAKIEEAIGREAERRDQELNEKLPEIHALRDQLEALVLDMRERSEALEARLLTVEETSKCALARLEKLECTELQLRTQLLELAERVTSLLQDRPNSDEDASFSVAHATLKEQQQMLRDVAHELTVRKQQNMLLEEAFKQLESRVDKEIIQNTSETSVSAVEQRVSQMLQAHMQAQRAALEEMGSHQRTLEEKINAGLRAQSLEACSPTGLAPVEAENLAGFREQLLNLSMRMSELQHVGEDNASIDETKVELETQRQRQARLEKALQQCARSGREAVYYLQTQVNQLMKEAKTNKDSLTQPAKPAHNGHSVKSVNPTQLVKQAQPEHPHPAQPNQTAMRPERRIKSGMRAEDPEEILTNGQHMTRRPSLSSYSSDGTPPSDTPCHPRASPLPANPWHGPQLPPTVPLTTHAPLTAASFGISSTLTHGVTRKEILVATQTLNLVEAPINIEPNRTSSIQAPTTAVTEVRPISNSSGEPRSIERCGTGSIHASMGTVTDVHQVSNPGGEPRTIESYGTGNIQAPTGTVTKVRPISNPGAEPKTIESYGYGSKQAPAGTVTEVRQISNPGGELRTVERNGTCSIHAPTGAVPGVRQVLDVQGLPKRGNAQRQTAQELDVDNGSPTMPALVSPTMEDFAYHDKDASSTHLGSAQLTGAPAQPIFYSKAGPSAAKKEDVRDDVCDFQ